MTTPFYKKAPITKISSLALGLGVNINVLIETSNNAEYLYIGPKPIKKNNGIRYVWDTREPLKNILKLINLKIFRHVYFPQFLIGSISGNDYISNAALHLKSQTLIKEDITKFFDNINGINVYSMWKNFFHFSDDVSSLLTKLTTKDGYLYQGTPSSSYIANLILWDKEPFLYRELEINGIRYSRYVDDITISSTKRLNKQEKTFLISKVYGMLLSKGFKPNRNKHIITNAPQNNELKIMGLGVSGKNPSIPKKERSNLRARIYQLEKIIGKGDLDSISEKELNSISGKIATLRRLHPKTAEILKCRLHKIKLLMSCSQEQTKIKK